LEKLDFRKSITYNIGNTFGKEVIIMAKQLLSGKLTSKGQLTIPVELRTLLNINEGDRLAFILDENERVIEVLPKTKKSIRRVMGALKSEANIDVDEAIEFAKIERAKAIDERLKELENE
jgi:looped-hinge helix DNA binding domain, AbrB family